MYDCGVTQGDVQVFRQADKPGRTFAGYASDTYGDGTSTCYREAEALGFDVKKPNGTGQERHLHRRDHEPAEPQTRRRSSRSRRDRTTRRSTRAGNYLYNSNSDLMTSVAAGDRGVRHLRLRRAAAGGRPVAAHPPGARHASRTTSPSASTATRAYSAALSQGVIIDTADPARPKVITELPRPDHQRLAPVRPVHLHRQGRQQARLRAHRGRVRRRGRRPGLPERRLPRLRRDRREGEQPARRSATGTSTTSARPPGPTRPAPRTCSASTSASS